MTTERPKLRYKRPWDRASQDKKKRAARRAGREPFIYFFRCRTFIKIGWTTDVAPRLSNVQMANPDIVTLAALMCGGEHEEKALHRAFKPVYHRAEWFREDGALAGLIGLIGGLPPTDARALAGDWFLKNYGKTTLLSYVPAAQNPDQDQRIQQESS